ncbi:hypothetical protein BH11ACT4_BH11ACT4_05370 [soil metagenome]
MTSAATMPVPIVALLPLGDANAAACEGDFCEIPEHHNQAIVNRKLDDDAV